MGGVFVVFGVIGRCCVCVVIGHTRTVDGGICNVGFAGLCFGVPAHALGRHLHRHAVSRPTPQRGEHQQQDDDQDTHG